MIVWKGLGFLVAVIAFGACVVAQLAFDAQFGAGFYSSHNWAVGTGLFAGGLVSALVGFVLS